MVKTKRALLTSALAIVMSIAMLIGSTYAWFTDTVSTSASRIKSGTLNVDIGYENDSGKWVSLEGETLNWKKANDIDEAVLWEPGAKYELREFQIKNLGTLALKYKIVISGATGDLDLLNVLDFTYTIGGEALDLNEEGHLLAEATTEPITIAAKMKESAGNEYQNKEINDIAITVYATQDTVESDSYDDQYDKDAPLDFVPVSTVAELKNVFANATAGEDVNVSLTDDIDLGADKTLMIVDGSSDIGDINIQANGHTIKNTVVGARVLQMANSNTERTITTSGAKIVSEGAVTSNENRGVQIFSVDNATVNLVNCDIEMKANDYSYPVKIGGTSKNTTVNITGCTLIGANCIENFGTNCTVNITDCVLNSNYAPGKWNGVCIQDKHGTNNTYNIKNTTFNGTNAQAWETSQNDVTTICDLGGNVDNTTITKN